MGLPLRGLGLAACSLVSLLGTPGESSAQCPSAAQDSLFGGSGYDGDEPEDFTHYVDANGDGICDFTGDANGNGRCDESTCRPIVAWDAEAGVHPNGVYPDCMLVLYEERTPRADVILQIGHSHWEYTHLQRDANGAPEEKDYLTVTQAMQQDLAAGDSSGTATRAALEASLRFLTGEPERFERFLLLNPSGRYWQVDEWIGPSVTVDGTLGTVVLPGLTWNERFFACGDENGLSVCARVNGTPSVGGYWSDHAEQLGLEDECGDGQLADPAPELSDPEDPDGRNAACGILFAECGP